MALVPSGEIAMYSGSTSFDTVRPAKMRDALGAQRVFLAVERREGRGLHRRRGRRRR